MNSYGYNKIIYIAIVYKLNLCNYSLKKIYVTNYRLKVYSNRNISCLFFYNRENNNLDDRGKI